MSPRGIQLVSMRVNVMVFLVSLQLCYVLRRSAVTQRDSPPDNYPKPQVDSLLSQRCFSFLFLSCVFLLAVFYKTLFLPPPSEPGVVSVVPPLTPVFTFNDSAQISDICRGFFSFHGKYDVALVTGAGPALSVQAAVPRCLGVSGGHYGQQGKSDYSLYI